MSIFRGTSLRPTRLSDLVRRGDDANRRRSWHDAETAYRAALDRDASLTHIWVQYGHALKEQRRLEPAELAYRRSLALDPTLADTHLQLGHVLKLQGRLDEAADAYVMAHRRDPTLPYPTIELRALGVEMPAPPRINEFPIDPDFIAALYGSAVDPAASPYMSAGHLLHEHGLSPEILEFFDYRYYFYANPPVQEELGRPDRHRCLLHFCQHGVDNALPCSEAFLFDAEFYGDTYLGRRLGPANAYWHWLNVGYAKDWHPNRDNWLKRRLGSDTVAFGSFDFAPCIAFFYGDDENAKWVDLFIRFINAEVLRPGPHFPITGDTADLFCTIAHRLFADEREIDALTLYERVLLDLPDHMPAALAYAECLMQVGFFFQAQEIYRRLGERDDHPACCLLNLATCCEELGDLGKALAALRRGIDRFPSEARFQLRFDTTAQRFFIREWQLALAIGRTGRYDAAQARVAECCARLTSLMAAEPPLAATPLRAIAIVGNLGLPQCTFYRVEQKIEHLRAAGFSPDLYDFQDELPQFIARLPHYQAVIFYRVPATAPVIHAITQANRFGLTTFYDIDDFIFGGEDYPGSIESFFGQITLDEYVELKLGVPAYRQAIALCEYGIASTPALARELAKIVRSGRAFVHRNALGQRQEQLSASEPARRVTDRVTIFYGSGTKSHKEDFRDLVEPALVEIVRRYGSRVTIVLVGYIVLSPELESIRPNLTIIDPIWGVEDYWAILKTADINIAVLKKTPMTDCKSEIKWLEAAMFGIPSVVSGTVTHDEAIEPGVTGLICNTAEEWLGALDLLVRDGELRRRIGRAAWHRVRDTYSVRRMGDNLASILEQATAPPDTAAKPKLVIVNVFYPPQAIGGATRIVFDNVTHLSQQYHDEFDIEVFTSGWGRGEEDYETRCYVQDGIRVTTVSRPALDAVERALSDTTMADIFGAYLDRTNPALIHFHCIQRLTPSVVSAALARGIPYLITAHDGWWISDVQFIVNEADEVVLYDYSDPLATGLKYGGAAYRRVIQLRDALFGAAKVLTVSDKFAELYRRCGVPNVVAIANGIAAIDAKPRAASTDGRVRLGFLGGIGHAKGYYLIKFALLSRKFAHLRLTVIDAGLAPGSSRQEVWNTTPIAFVPKYPEDRVAELYATIDVLLAPSVCIESFGLVTREALHCGCWVVASDRGSIGDCVTEGQNGYVVDVSDAMDLIRVLTLIDGEPDRYRAPPPAPPMLRRASQQGDELAALYRSIVAVRRSDAAADDRAGSRAQL